MSLPFGVLPWVWFLAVTWLFPTVLRATLESRADKLSAPSQPNITFTRSNYRATIPENSVGKTYATADEKMGIFIHSSHQESQYKIVSGDGDKIFKAEEQLMGNFLFLLIRTRTGNSVVLNRERKDSFVLGVRGIIKMDDRTVELSTVVTISVSDRNDLRPLFYQTSYQVTVAEDTPVHTSVIRIHAEDADLGKGGEVYYRFRDSNSDFAIHPITGVITLTKPLRFSERRSYVVTVLAQDRGDSLQSNPPSSAKLSIVVKQVNLYNPEISVEHLNEFYETSDANIYAIITVTDKDTGKNGRINKLEISDGDSNGHFRIKHVQSISNNTNEYNLMTYKLLHRERYSKIYNLTLKASDMGIPPRQVYSTVVIHVEPITPKYPIFEKEIYDIDILECVPINSPIIRLKMTENDQFFHNDIHLEIVGGNEDGTFRLNPLTGMLYTANELDAELKNMYTLTISALEHGKSGYSMQSSAKVKINVIDINDNDPIFEGSESEVSVTENEPAGTSVARVVAKDKDSGENGYISYSIANLNPVPFEIDHFTGVIRTIENLDYETMRRETILYVRASDWGLPFRRQTEMELKVRLRDINDNKPLFERVNCSGSLSRFSPIGYEIMSLSAIDFDSGNIISYRIVSKNTEGCFNLDLTSGILSVSCDLRYENFTERTINTAVTDGMHYSQINPIKIRINNEKIFRGTNFESDSFVCNETGVAKRLKETLNLAAKNNMPRSTEQKDISIMPKRYGENVHSPEILNLPATVQVNESSALGSKLFRIQARDRDLGYNGKLVFGITSGDKDSLFRLDPESGILKTIGHLDYEKETEYNLNVIVFDLGRPQKSSTSYITVVILDNNDNIPRFQQPMASSKITENTPNGTAIFKAIATDSDSPENAQVFYSLSTESENFMIDSTTGVLYVTTPPDREINYLFEIRIRASDQGSDISSPYALHSESIVLITVEDINDNSPKFIEESLIMKVKEDMPVGCTVAIIEATDADLGVKGEIGFSIVGNSSFTIDPFSGALRLLKPLDYEERQRHELNVTACDRGIPSLCTSRIVIVKVVDVNENIYAPQFGDFAVSASVLENQPPGAIVTVVKATDDDPPGEDSRVGYHIAGGDGVGYFSIDDNGVIRTTSTLDAEGENHFWLTVFAQDHGLVPLRARLEVYISVGNVNDNVPLTAEPVYYPTVLENSPPFTPIVQITAEDADLDPDQRLTFNITAGNVDGFFEINYLTGLLTTTRNKIDREYQAEHDLEITVSDGGVPPLSSSTRVVVLVDDVNDNAPQFEQSFYHVVLPQSTRHKQSLHQMEEDSSSHVSDTAWDHVDKSLMGEPFLRVLATDKDSGSNSLIEYSIKAGRGKGRFNIHPEMGIIYSHKPFSAGQDFELMVRATDHGFPNKSSTARIAIQVIGVPEAKSPPFVKMKQQRVEVTESDPVGFLVALVQATDENDYLWFKINDGDTRGEFVMGGDPGSVLLAKQLDCETQNEYNLTISISNGVHTIYTQLYVGVLDINEHRPQFSQREYLANVSEGASVGQLVVTVQGVDLDRGGEVVYDLHNAQSPDTLSLFALDHETGSLTVHAPLDRETVAEHVITLVAKDQGTPMRRNFARLRVRVEDANNHAPQWSDRLIQGYVLQTAEPGATVLSLLASDRDHGDNADLRYAILSGNIGKTFDLHPSLGILSLASSLDGSKLTEYILTIQATDNGHPPLSSTVPVHITVIVADETTPRFLAPLFTVQIYENEPKGIPVVHLDVGASSSLFFEIKSGNEKGSFTINPSTGSVTTLETLDREDIDFYNLTIEATNSAGAKAVCNLIVNVLDKNDNAPQLLISNYVGYVLEDVPVGSLIQTNDSNPLVIYATDVDVQTNALLRFKILEPKAARMFIIDGFTGTIRTKIPLDYESVNNVTFTVRVFDLGDPKLSSDVTAKVYINIQDVNDCMPRFLQTEYNLSLFVPSYPDANLIMVEATDEDTPEVTELRYMILTGNKNNWFQIKPETGLLSVQGVQPHLKGSHTLRVAVSDGRYSAQARVNVHWQESSSAQLVFQHAVYQGYVTENTTKPVTVTVVSVLGGELNQHIRFSIANPCPGFHIGLTSGAFVTTGVPFDREERDRYLIYVQAEFESTDDVRQVTQTVVNISVVDVNDNCPVFVNTPYLAVVSVSTQKHVPITKVLALDLDEGENGEVRYELTKGQGELFRVDRKTGEISLKQTIQSTQEAYIIITAYDGGLTPCSTEVTVTVKVVEDSVPIFERQLYTVTVLESLPPHSLLPLRLVADAPLSHPVLYSISSNPDGLFTVDVTAGALFTDGRLDYERSAVLRVGVRATDSLTGEAADTMVTVLLTDVNDNKPRFPQRTYNISVLESTPVGTLVAVIKAYDNDTGLNSRLQYSITPLNGVLKVTPQTGSLVLQQPLDREHNSTFHLVLTASDSGLPKLSGSADIWLHVLDINDNPPRFERPTYHCRLPEESTRGQLVTSVTAKDPDLGTLRYLIAHGNDLLTFRIHPQTGVITLLNLVNLAQTQTHILNVSVTDGVHTSFCRVSVEVQLTNRHAPVFSSGTLEAAVEENQLPGTLVTTVSAIDRDVGAYGVITYSIPSELMAAVFKIDPKTGVIRLGRALDREDAAMLEVPVLATDGGGRADFSTVRVTVTDVNDNAPEFHFPEYHSCISANLSVDSVFLKVKAQDKDIGPAGMVEYSIYNLQAKRVKHLFGINPQTGSIVLLQAPVQYEGQHFQFFVRAADNGLPPLFSDVAVHVYVTRPGDQPPTFHRRDQHVFVPENAPPGTVVTQVKLVVPHNVQYKLLHDHAKFTIDSAGTVTVTSPLDRESVPFYTLGVLAVSPPLTGFTEIHVKVVDINDNPPRFQGSSYSIRVAENVPEGTSVVRVSADDKDEGSSGEVRFALKSSFFTVDPYSGWVSTLTLLDRETTPRHSLLLTAFDNGDPVLSSTALLNIDIVDYNDSPPVFSEPSYMVTVKESAPVGSSVCQLAVTDADSSSLDYHIVSGDPYSQFGVRSTGQLYLVSPLDREHVDSYGLIVAVTDSKYVVQTTVRITVDDVNDNSPKCFDKDLDVTVREDLVPGSTVLTVLAEDTDLDPKLKYYLTGTNHKHFFLQQLTGELKSAVALDRESVSEYHLVAHVQDQEFPSWECLTSLTITLNDVNDNPPAFPSKKYTAAVPEDYPVGGFVTILQAVDPDLGLNRKIIYIILESDGEYFTVDPGSGLVQVAHPLDRGLKAMYSLAVQASDQGTPSLSSTTTLNILVVDVNDNPPEFSSRSYHAVVSESAPVGAEVTRISATSVDDGVQSTLVYSIVAGNEFGKFMIEPQTDRIRVANPLDYEEARQYLLTVVATDTAEHPLSTHTTVNISVSDSNDNAPQFSQPSYSAEISELSAQGYTVMQVSALDADSGDNGLVRYNLVGEKSREFHIDSATGVIKLSSTLDREKADSYVLRVQARDSGQPTLSSVAVVHVTVTDVNDNPPIFVTPNMTAIFQEDKPAGWAVCQLIVTDADVFPNTAPFIFEILYDDSGGKFRIDSKGVLQTLTQFRKQSQDNFHLQVRVYDNGSPPLFADSWITIKVIEESKFLPEVLPLHVTVVSYEDRWGGGELGQVVARDRDPYDVLSYELTPSSSLFAIDHQLGVVRAPSGLDAGRYPLHVSVSDGRLGSQVLVEVVVRPLWAESLQHAVSLRFSGISPETFLLKESENLVKAMESILLRNVSIVSIQKSSSKHFDVLLIIMGGIDLIAVEEILQTIGLRTIPPACKCKNGAKCRQRVQIEPQRQSRIRTNTTVFISPEYSFTLYCACALGFTGDLCEDHLPASECACAGSQTCLNPPCVAPSCSNNRSCFPTSTSNRKPISTEQIFGVITMILSVLFIASLFMVYRRCYGGRGQDKERREHPKQAGTLDKLDITQISGSYCQQDILAGINLNSLQRTTSQPETILETTLAEEPGPEVMAVQRAEEPGTEVVAVQRGETADVESYGFPSHRHQTFQVS